MNQAFSTEYQAGRAKPRGHALVVDDDETSRMLLAMLLEDIGFCPIAAGDGEEAIEIFRKETPDIVFVDIVMPGIDGYETAGRIKQLAGERFVPVIFVTSHTDEHSLAWCLEAGGDAFLAKPVSAVLLRAEIDAVERIAQLYRTVQRQRHELVYEQELAKQVYAKAVTSDAARLEGIRILQRPASIFSGDIVLAERSPSGALHVLVGDFTGHGLAAAIGALPAADAFRGMTAKGFTAPEILDEINCKLRQTLPTGMFLAAVFVSLTPDGHSVSIHNSGLPDVVILDGAGTGTVRHHIRSSSLPLGISCGHESAAAPFEWVNLGPDDQIVVLTDGIIEARGRTGEVYGEERLLRCLERRDGVPFDRLVAELDAFVAGAPLEDDLTLAMIPARLNLAGNAGVEDPAGYKAVGACPPTASRTGDESDWQWDLELTAPILKRLDVIPLLVDTVVDMQDLRSQRQALFTVVSELFNNALDHGILGLASAIKDSSDGFARYFQERQARLATLSNARVHVTFRGKSLGDHGFLEIRMEDDGQGFDYEHWQPQVGSARMFSGRGIALVRGLCASLEYEPPGNVARAVYRW